MIRKADKDDIQNIAKLANQMWTDSTVDNFIGELNTLIENGEVALFVAEENDECVGFAQCQLRHDYVEGTKSSPVGYLEGIFVKEEYRNKGYASSLLKVSEAWAKENGCSEFASDCELINNDSLMFHLKVGFEEANRIICFTKKL